MVNYSDFVSLLKEGLIKTHSIIKVEQLLEHQLNFNGFESNIDVVNKYIYTVLVKNSSWLTDIKKCELFFNINGNFGYFPNKYFVYKEDKQNSFNFIKDNKYGDIDLSDFIYKIENWDKVKIRFEAKFDTGLYKNDVDVPDVSYHLSPTKNRDSILKNGLVVKSNNRLTYHKDRIYLFKFLNDYNKLLNTLKNSDSYNLGEPYLYDLYEIKIDKNNYIFHIDPYYKNGFYTYDYISPINIKIIKQDL